MLCAIFRTCKMVLLGGLILCATASCLMAPREIERDKMAGEKRADIKRQTAARDAWAGLTVPELGVRQVDNSPLHRTRTYVWIRMPQVQATWNVVDMECYEGPTDLELLGHRVLDGGVLELRQRCGSQPHVIVVTELTPEPGKVKLVARLELDPEKGADKAFPEDMPELNLCFDLKRSRGAFDSYPDPFPEIINRCFIFTDKGRTFLSDTVRRNLPRIADAVDDPRNNPPWIQVYSPVWLPVSRPSTGDTWYNRSTDRYTIPLLGVVSRDGKHLIALASDTSDKVCQAWAPCLHICPTWLPKDAPPVERRWYMNIYIMPNDPQALLERVAEDFPNALKLQEKRVPAGKWGKQ